MAGKAFQRDGYRLRGDRGRSGEAGAAEAEPEGRPGPSARPHGRATGQGRHGGADARSAESTRHRDRRAEPEDVPRQGRAAGTQDGEVRGSGGGNGIGRRSVLSAMTRSAGRERRYRSKSGEPWAICDAVGCWERVRATAMARQRRACCEAVGGGEPPKGGERGASGGGAQRRAAMRSCGGWARAAGDGSGATEPRRRMSGVLPLAPASEARSERCERRRQGSSPEGRRPRQRASWSRAGRSRARRNRARRPVARPGGRPDLLTGGADDMRNPPRTIGDDRGAEGIEESRTVPQVMAWWRREGCETARGNSGELPMAAREARRRYAVRRTASRRAEERDGF